MSNSKEEKLVGARKRKPEMADSSSDNEEEDRFYISGALIEFVKNNKFLYDSTDSRYKNAELRRSTYAQFESEHFLKAGEANNLWRRLLNAFHKDDREEKKRNLSGSGASPPMSSFTFKDEMSFLKDVKKQIDNHRASSRTTSSGENTHQKDDSAQGTIKSDIPSLSGNISAETTELLEQTGHLKKNEEVRTERTGKVKKRRNQSSNALEEAIASSEQQLKDVLAKLGEDSGSDYPDLVSKLVSTMNSIPSNVRDAASNELYTFLSNLKRKYNCPLPQFSSFPTDFQNPFSPFPNNFAFHPFSQSFVSSNQYPQMSQSVTPSDQQLPLSQSQFPNDLPSSSITVPISDSDPFADVFSRLS